MAQKYLMAMDYVDFHAQGILKKHSKKRPLGDLETRHRYTPTQPVLSCRTVDIDVSGTRTYRPKSSADIIQEQHALIHRIYSKARNVASAPQRRVRSPAQNSEDSFQKPQIINSKLNTVEVQGRPLTSQSQTSFSTPRKTPSSSRRPKTTGNLKKAQRPTSEGFLVVKTTSRTDNNEFVETRRSYRNLTNKIHQQWEPENHDLNSGVYQRGKKRPDINTSQDAWLTFSGSQAEEAEGLIDAFADEIPEEGEEEEELGEEEEEVEGKAESNSEKKGDFYNIEGGVGSRIAQQLQKGDKIRIGINGQVQSQDLKVKKWHKEDSSTSKRPEEMEEGRASNASNKENMNKGRTVIPLCWDDQLQQDEDRVVTPRGQPLERTTINLCETRPVIFNKLLLEEGRDQQSRASYYSKQGFRVKQRHKHRAGVDGKEQKNKVTVLTIDSRSEEEERVIEDLTVDEVVKRSCEGKESEKGSSMAGRDKPGRESTEKHVTLNLNIELEGGVEDSMLSPSKVSIPESVSSSGSEHYKAPKARPTPPTYSTKSHQVELGIIGTLPVPPNSRPLSSEYDPRSPMPAMRAPLTPKFSQPRLGSARSSRSSSKPPTSAMSATKSIASSSCTSIASVGMKPNDAEYILISQPVKNPNPANHSKKTVEYVNPGVNNDLMRARSNHSGIREPMPSPELGHYEEGDGSVNSPPPSPRVKPAPVAIIKPTTPSLSINIPTAESYSDSALNSPHRNGGDPDSGQISKREQDLRDDQIDQITELIGGSIIGQDGESRPAVKST